MIELAADEVAALAGDGFVDLAHERGLADAGVARDEDELDGAGSSAIEGAEERLYLCLAAVELLRDAELVGDVLSAEREGIDLPGSRPLGEAALEVDL